MFFNALFHCLFEYDQLSRSATIGIVWNNFICFFRANWGQSFTGEFWEMVQALLFCWTCQLTFSCVTVTPSSANTSSYQLKLTYCTWNNFTGFNLSDYINLPNPDRQSVLGLFGENSWFLVQVNHSYSRMWCWTAQTHIHQSTLCCALPRQRVLLVKLCWIWMEQSKLNIVYKKSFQS